MIPLSIHHQETLLPRALADPADRAVPPRMDDNPAIKVEYLKKKYAIHTHTLPHLLM